jgi:hypothetical protein
LQGTASQSSDFGTQTADLAIDNSNSTFSHTQVSFGQWWQVELLTALDVEGVLIMNRGSIVSCSAQNRLPSHQQ